MEGVYSAIVLLSLYVIANFVKQQSLRVILSSLESLAKIEYIVTNQRVGKEIPVLVDTVVELFNLIQKWDFLHFTTNLFNL